MEELKDLGKLVMTEGANKALQQEMLLELKKIKELPDWLRDVMSEDVKRYFNATTPVEQLLTKGAYFRTKWMLGKILEVNKLPGEKPPKQLKVARYAR